jgi:hypothetical protein
MGFEPTTSGFVGRCSTVELLGLTYHIQFDGYIYQSEIFLMAIN